MDSMRVRNLNRLSSMLYRGYPDSARAYSKEALILSQQLGYIRGEAQAQRLYGYTFYVQGKFDSTLFYLDNALGLYQSQGNVEGEATVNAAKGAIYASQDEFELAIQTFLEASTNFESFGNVSAQGTMLNNIGNVYLEQELIDEAYQYYLRALEVLDTPNTQPILAMIYANLSSAAYNLGEFDISLGYVEKGIQYSLEYERLVYLNSLYITRGKILMDRDDYEGALESFLTAKEYNAQFGYVVKEMDIRYSLAVLYERTGQYSEARSNLLHIITNAEEQDLKLANLLPNALSLLARVEQHLGNYASGLEYAQRANTISDSLYKQEMSLKISELETIYETEKKEAQIQLLEVENQVANLKVVVIGIAGLVLVVGLSFGFWQFYRRKAEEKRLKMETMKQELHQFGMVISEKNNFINRFREDLDEVRQHVRSMEGRKELSLLVDSIHQNVNLTEDEEELFQKIEKLNTGFYTELRKRYNNLTPKDERLATLVQMDLSNKDIANILHVEPDSVKQARRRLKRKLELGSEIDLTDYLKSLAA